MKFAFAALALGLSISATALAGPFNMGSPQPPAAAQAGAMTGSSAPTANLGGFTERDTGYRRDGSKTSQMSRPDPMTGATTRVPHPSGWIGPDAWNS